MFGVDFVSKKIVMETLQGIRYKLIMMGVPISGPPYIYGENMSVIHNTQRPESTLKKNCNYICYQDFVSLLRWLILYKVHVGTNKNSADLATKVLYGGKHGFYVSRLIYEIYDDM